MTRFHQATIRRFMSSSGFPVIRVQVPGSKRAALRFELDAVMSWLREHGGSADPVTVDAGGR